MLLRRVAAVHGALGTALGITHFVLIVTFRCLMVLPGCCFMLGGSLFVQDAGVNVV